MAVPQKPKRPSAGGRRLLNLFNSALGALAALAIVVLLNYVAGGHFRRWQMDENSVFKLSEETVRVLNSLTNDVNITIFFEPQGPNSEIYGLVSGLLTEYQQACPRHIHVRTLNYDTDAGAAKEFLAKYNLNGPREKDFIHFECGGATKIAFAKELASYDFSDLMAGRSKTVRRSGFLGEMFFTGDIYNVSNPSKLKAYFLTGHGENDPAETQANNGYAKLAEMLKTDDDCAWAKLSLQGTNMVPADCSLLIVPASARETMIPPAELAKIALYLKKGGRLLALLTVRSGMESVLGEWGIGIGGDDNRVVDLDPKWKLPSPGTFLTANMSPHAIMDPLAKDQIPIMMVFPRQVYGLEDQSKIPGAPQITILAATSARGMNETKHTGVFPLMAAVEQGNIQGVNSPSGRGTRIVVAGDSDFLDNLIIGSEGNHLFAHQALGWLLQEPQIMLSGLGPHPIQEYRLYMTTGQAQAIRWLFVAGLPGAVLLLGGLVWLRRRS